MLSNHLLLDQKLKTNNFYQSTKPKLIGDTKMANINIDNLDLNGNDLFNDSESFITELDDNEESIVGGYYYYPGYCGDTCGNTGCGVTIGNCGNTNNCGNTIGG